MSGRTSDNEVEQEKSSTQDRQTSNVQRYDSEASIQKGQDKFSRLGWKRLTICLIVEAIALGSLSIPSVFATVGMVAGVTLTVGIGLIAIYTSYLVGEVKLKYPAVSHYSDAVALCWGKFGRELTSIMFVLLLVLLVGSHTLTSTIAWIHITNNYTTCALVWGAISAVILFVLALPPTFAEFAILGYVDFVSIIAAIGITIVATGIEAHNAPGGLAAVNWSVWPPPDVTFYKALLSVTNIIFAYSFSVCQYSFMCEMHTPKDYVKSIWALGLMEIVIYTVTGATIYAFTGGEVGSPALLSASNIVVRVAFGVALPVIFISGSINSTVVARFILDRTFPNSPIKYINNLPGWIVWITLIATITIVGWVIAEAVPFFNDLLGLISALFVSGFTFYFPAMFWFYLLKEGEWNANAKNIMLSIVNASIFLIGMVVLFAGSYATILDILEQYKLGRVQGSFTCDARSYK